MPDAFQIPELVTARVGSEGANNVDDNKYRFALDYRLAAAVQIPLERFGALYRVRATFGPNDARPLTGTPVQLANPDLSLCQHVGTGIIGYYLSTELFASGIANKSW